VGAPAPDVSADGDLVLDRRAHVVTRNGDELSLTAREFALLDWFLSHSGVAHRRDELMRAVWGWEFGDESTVTVHVRRLREKVEAEPSAPRRLVTVFGVGYRWDSRPPDVA
jgi:DNA-binding response OmpR family regulator